MGCVVIIASVYVVLRTVLPHCIDLEWHFNYNYRRRLPGADGGQMSWTHPLIRVSIHPLETINVLTNIARLYWWRKLIMIMTGLVSKLLTINAHTVFARSHCICVNPRLLHWFIFHLFVQRRRRKKRGQMMTGSVGVNLQCNLRLRLFQSENSFDCCEAQFQSIIFLNEDIIKVLSQTTASLT